MPNMLLLELRYGQPPALKLHEKKRDKIMYLTQARAYACAQTLKVEHTKNLMLGNPSRLARLWARLMPRSL